MHKSRKRHALERTKVRDKKEAPKRRWGRYLLVPAAIAAIGFVAYGISHKSRQSSSETRPVPAAARDKPEERHSDQFIVNPKGGTVKIPSNDIEAIIQSSCCSMIIVKTQSPAVLELSRSYKTGLAEALTIGSFRDSDGLWRGLSVVPADPPTNHGETEFDELFGKSASSARELIQLAGKSSGLKEMKRLIDDIRPERPNDRASGIGDLYHTVAEIYGQKSADELLNELAQYSILREALSVWFDGCRTRKARFLTIISHETTHAAQSRYKKMAYEPGKSPDTRGFDEDFGCLAGIAFGPNTWTGVRDLLSFASEALPFKIAGPAMQHQPEMRYLELLLGLVKELGISGPLELPDKNEDEIRAAARRLLDKHSVRVYGKPFGEIVPIADIEEIIRQGSVIFDKRHQDR